MIHIIIPYSKDETYFVIILFQEKNIRYFYCTLLLVKHY